MERLGKDVPAATDTHARMKSVVCTVRAEELIRKIIGAAKSVLYGSL
jgi:hypothetical protein